MPTSDNPDVPDARMRRSARWALGAGILAVFTISLTSNRGDWARSLLHALLFAVLILVGARFSIGKTLWKLLF